jgi:hypothetical protein
VPSLFFWSDPWGADAVAIDEETPPGYSVEVWRDVVEVAARRLIRSELFVACYEAVARIEQTA